ncbi:MAG: hypothetical protein DRQ39_10065, partial [Gammaproteobacteria bacterium]
QKENIQNISGALGIIMNLKGVRYDLKKEYCYDESLVTDSNEQAIRDVDRKNIIGFLAQDVYEVLPEVVNYDDSTDNYSMNYSRIVAVLVEGMKEQQSQIETLENQINSILSPSPEFKGASIDQEPSFDLIDVSGELFQNAPNPFTDETTIKYFLGENVKDASIIIFDMTGKQLKTYKLHHFGNGEINIYGGVFNAGMYMYTMIADGRVIGSRQMILTEKD